MLLATTMLYSQYYKDRTDSCLCKASMVNPDSLVMDTCGYPYKNVRWEGFDRAYGQRWFVMEFPFSVIDTNIVPIDKATTFGIEGVNKQYHSIINGLKEIPMLFGGYKLRNGGRIDLGLLGVWSTDGRYILVEFDNYVKLDSAEYYLNNIAKQENGEAVYVKRYSFLASTDNDGNFNAEEMTLTQNRPNPFSDDTDTSFSIPNDSHVLLTVLDAQGTVVATLVNEPRVAGKSSVNFPAGGLPSGTYIYRLNAAGRELSRTMQIVR